ncbi:MAG TPA: type IX secretion system membrane protein PorP/SprF [Sphingobacteriaceae bacterium]|nr:type IX secretion system membrane protein PorP/SprF [Sphingobacteriaceae bacterium]
MRNSIILTLAMLVSCSFALKAQQNAQYSQYMFHGLYINPAYAGYKGDLNLHSYYRSQWTNMEGGPRTMALAADMALDSDKVGLGFNIVNDRVGMEKRTAAYFNYAYRLRLDEANSRHLSLGVGAGFVHGSYNQSDIITGQPEPISLESIFLPDVRIGVFYNSPLFFAGAGIENLLSSIVMNDEKASIQPSRHYFMQAGGIIPVTSDVLLKPTTLLKTASNSPNQAWTWDLNAAVLFAEQFTLGVTYRTGFLTGSEASTNLSKRNSIIALAEFQTKSNIRVGYSYDHPLSSTVNNLGGTHEISVGYLITKQRIRERTPRFF